MIELTKYTKETYTLPDGRDVIKEVTIFSDGHAVIMEWRWCISLSNDI